MSNPKSKKPKVSFRLSDFAISTFTKYDGKDRTDKLENALTRLADLEEHAQTKAPSEIADCKQRIQWQEKHYCVQTDRKGLNRLKELPTLEICNICLLKKLNIPDGAKKTPAQAAALQNMKEPTSERNVFCSNDGGMYVYPTKCALCKEHAYAKWKDCKTKAST